jgi:hypothetical protein
MYGNIRYIQFGFVNPYEKGDLCEFFFEIAPIGHTTATRMGFYRTNQMEKKKNVGMDLH